MRIAMWSGPRNISTALMRAWENRPDTYVCDEPLYAHYLADTGLDHPGREATLAAHETDWRRVVNWLTGPIPGGHPIWYQKQMAHHLLPQIDRDWTSQLVNCFLIRDPREMLTSLLEFLPDPRVEDTGLPQQVELFEQIRSRTGETPPVIDGRDVLLNPEGMLRALCERLGLPFRQEMLSWPAGRRETDGAWASEWYRKVELTTGFGTYEPKPDTVPSRLQGVLEDCEACYQKLVPWRLRIDSQPIADASPAN